jgi:hypothetical protein
MVHCYDIKNSFDFFRKLLDEREDFLKNPASARFAINCAITAWQLHDWVYADREKYPFMKQFQSKSDFRNYLYLKERDFRTIHDLADGAKHYQLTSRTTTILDTAVSNWKKVNKFKEVSDETSQLFLTMKFGNVGMTMTFDDLLFVITHFWYKLFKDDFKEDLDELFEYYTWF